MSNQKVMRCHFNHPGQINPGDIAQCPACRWKFVLLPDMINPFFGGVSCPKCKKATDLSYYQTLSLTGGIELTNWGKNDETKEVKPDADVHKRPRKGSAQQRTGEQDRSKANRAKAGGTRSKSDKGHG